MGMGVTSAAAYEGGRPLQKSGGGDFRLQKISARGDFGGFPSTPFGAEAGANEN